MSYIDRIEGVSKQDISTLKRKDAEYGGSWLKRGGVGAFFSLSRKWDRLEEALKPGSGANGKPLHQAAGMLEHSDRSVSPWDIIDAGVKDGREEGILDDIGDLRRYLLLVEAEIRERLDLGKSQEVPPSATYCSCNAPERGLWRERFGLYSCKGCCLLIPEDMASGK